MPGNRVDGRWFGRNRFGRNRFGRNRFGDTRRRVEDLGHPFGARGRGRDLDKQTAECLDLRVEVPEISGKSDERAQLRITAGDEPRPERDDDDHAEHFDDRDRLGEGRPRPGLRHPGLPPSAVLLQDPGSVVRGLVVGLQRHHVADPLGDQ